MTNKSSGHIISLADNTESPNLRLFTNMQPGSMVFMMIHAMVSNSRRGANLLAV